jgi:hypothetical protein
MNILDQKLFDYMHCNLVHKKKPFATGELKKDEDGFIVPVIEWRCVECECKTALNEGKT